MTNQILPIFFPETILPNQFNFPIHQATAPVPLTLPRHCLCSFHLLDRINISINQHYLAELIKLLCHYVQWLCKANVIAIRSLSRSTLSLILLPALTEQRDATGSPYQWFRLNDFRVCYTRSLTHNHRRRLCLNFYNQLLTCHELLSLIINTSHPTALGRIKCTKNTSSVARSSLTPLGAVYQREPFVVVFSDCHFPWLPTTFQTTTTAAAVETTTTQEQLNNSQQNCIAHANCRNYSLAFPREMSPTEEDSTSLQENSFRFSLSRALLVLSSVLFASPHPKSDAREMWKVTNWNFLWRTLLLPSTHSSRQSPAIDDDDEEQFCYADEEWGGRRR